MAEEKFGRQFRVTIDPQDGGGLIIVTMPFTISFEVNRNIQSSLNQMYLDIYNLSESTRDRIFQDRFAPRTKKVTLELGYETTGLSLVFSGNIFEASSARENTEIITRIEALDGNFATVTQMTFETLGKGQKISDVLKHLIGQLPELEYGAVGEFDEVLQRPVSLNGNTYDLLKKYSNNQVYVDNGKVYVLRRHEIIPATLPLINSASGLLETPRRDDGYLTITTLMEPRIAINQQLELESSVLNEYNGVYKVVGLMHQGTISNAVNGVCRSQFSLFVGSRRFTVVQ